MLPAEAKRLAEQTMGYLHRLDHADTHHDVKTIMDAFVPWAKASGVAPQIRAHVAAKAKALHHELDARSAGRPVHDRKSAAAGHDQ